MSRLSIRGLFLRVTVVATALALGVAFAADPSPTEPPKVDPQIKRVKQTASDLPTGGTGLPQGQPPTPPPTAPAAPSTTGPSAPTNQQSEPATPSGPAATNFSSGNIATQPNSDLGAILESSGSSGVDIQRRNAVVADPRVRGYHVNQLLTFGDGALFVPARLDLDSALSKYDAGSIRDIVVIKGPYSVRYGPGFAFLDIVTFDTPRAKDGCDYEIHGRTLLGYQTNGGRLDGLQSVDYGAKDWGYRLTYNILAGNDYRDGDGNKIPSSYNSQNFNLALGFDLDKNNKVEFKAIRLYQHDLEFPGTYFDINALNTEAYNLRFTSKDSCYYDQWTVDAWYNATVVDGDTDASYKYNFLRRFLPGPGGFGLVPSFNPDLANNPLYFRDPQSGGFLPFLNDVSKTRIAENSIGLRSAMTWGPKDCLNVTAGFDFTYVAQGLKEYIRIQDPTQSVPVTRQVTQNGIPILFQDLNLPNSYSYNPGLFLDTNLPVGDRLTLRAGARVDYVHTTTGDRLITGNIDIYGPVQDPPPGTARDVVNPVVFSVDPTNNSTTRDFGLISAYLSGDYKFDDHLTGLMGAGYAQRPPSLYELYSGGPFVAVVQPGFTRLIGDPRLDPEKLMQFDTGFKADYGWFKGSVNGFYAWINDYITFDLNANAPAPGITQNIYTNTDRATLAGGEIYGQVEATSWLTPFGALSYVQGRDLTHRSDSRPDNLASVRRNGAETEPLPGIPPLEARTGLRIHESVPLDTAPKWSLELSARTVRDQNLVAASLFEQPTPGFTTFDARGFWQISEHVLVTAGVENIGNKQYREHLDFRPYLSNIFRPGTNYYFATQFKY